MGPFPGGTEKRAKKRAFPHRSTVLPYCTSGNNVSVNRCFSSLTLDKLVHLSDNNKFFMTFFSGLTDFSSMSPSLTEF